MFLLDNLLLAPGKAAFFLLKELAAKAQEEWLDDESVKQELQELYALLESGRISEHDFEAREISLVERLQQIARAKLQDGWGGGDVSTPESNGYIGAGAAPETDGEAALSTVEDVPAFPEVVDAGASNREVPFASIAATLRPFLEMVTAGAKGSGQQVDSHLNVRPLPDFANLLPPAPGSSDTSPDVPGFSRIVESPGRAADAIPRAPHMSDAAAREAGPVIATPVAPAIAQPGPVAADPPRAGAPLTIAQVIEAALQGLSALRMRVSSVTSVARAEGGWRVSAELVERRGVPDTSDLLGLYELRLDEAGNVLQWERTRMRRRCDLSH